MQREVENRMRCAQACLVFFYPLYMAAQFVLNALPALIRRMLFGEQMASFRISPVSISAVAAATGSAATPSGAPGAQDPSYGALLLTVSLVLAAVLLLGLTKRKNALLIGLAVAMLGQVGLHGPTWRIFFLKNVTVEAALEFLFLFSIVCLGLRWMLAGGPEQNFASRAVTLLCNFNLPLLLLGAVLACIFQFRTTRFFAVMIPCAIASLLASTWPSKALEDKSKAPGWTMVLAGVICTVLVIVGVVWGGPAISQALREAELAKGRAAMEALPPIPADAPYEKTFFQKGVSYTAEFPAVYTSEAAREMLKQLPSYGVNAIALVPFGGATRNPPGVRFFSANSWESDEGLEQLSRVAHSINVKVMLKPQLWARGGDWLDPDIPDAAERAKWFAEYQLFIEHYARLATRIHADLFCVGVELRSLVRYDAEWRKLIARVRELYPGPLVYAANFGAEFESVAFWDALDYIGLDNYYPLPDDFSTDAVVGKVEAVQKKYQRPVLFTEAGFASLEGTHQEPWAETPGKLSLEEQARGYEAVFRAFYGKPWFAGVYWWKVGTNGRGGPKDASHTPWGKPAMDVMRRWYLEGKR